MNTRIASVFVLAAALSASASVPAFAAPTAGQPIAYSVSVVHLDAIGRDCIQRGSSRTDVLNLMGAPNEQLSPDVWLYWGYHADTLKLADSQGCRTMIVRFSRNQVADLKFVNKPAVVVIAADVKRGAADSLAATP